MLYQDVHPDLAKVSVVDSDDTYKNGYIEGYASVFGNVDLGGDVVEKGAFKKTLKERLNSGAIKFVDSHRIYEGTQAVVGVVSEAKEDDYGLWFRSKMSSVQRAQDIRTKVREGVLNALSFGYEIVKENRDPKTQELHLIELKLYEISAVIWGMNPSAQIEGVKGKQPDTFADFPVLKDIAKAWDPEAVVLRIKTWVSDKPVDEWEESEWIKFSKCFMWKDPNRGNALDHYRLPVADIVDGVPTYIFRGAVHSLKQVRHDATFESSRSQLERHIEKVYQKFETPFPVGEVIDPVSNLVQIAKQTVVDMKSRALLSDMRDFASTSKKNAGIMPPGYKIAPDTQAEVCYTCREFHETSSPALGHCTAYCYAVSQRGYCWSFNPKP